MSELTKKLHILKTGGTEEEVTLYDSTDDCEEPYLSFTVDGANAYAKLGETTDDNATSLRIYRNSDKATYAVLAEATPAVIIDDLFTQIVMRTVTEIVDDGEEPLITSIGNYAFDSCSKLTTVDLPAATSIGNYAFDSCSNLTTVDLPAATSIGNSAFHYCSNLTTVDLPAATSIGNSAFHSCSNLTTVDLPAATSIENYAFYSCSNLTTVDLPAATSIGNYAFDSCSKLKEIHFAAANKATIEANSYYSSKWGATNATIYFDL